MNQFKFKVRFAIRNIFHNRGNSFSIFFSLTLVAMFLILMANVFFAFKQVFYYQNQEVYDQIDIVMTFDENATARLINRRNVENTYGSELNQALSFFNLYVLAETEEDYFYTELMSSLPHEMEQLINYDLVSFSSNSVAITTTMANEYQIQVGDYLDLSMLSRTYSYQVVQIIPDRGLFSGTKVFVDKSTLMYDFYGFSLLDNLGNTVYLDVLDSQNIATLFSTLINDDEFSNYLIYLTIDEEVITNDSTFNAAVAFGLGIMITITIGMVLHSLFPLLSKKLGKQYGTIQTLGGNARFISHIWSVQLILLFIFSSILGIFFGWIILNLSARSYGISSTIQLDWLPSVVAIFLLAIVMVGEGSYHFRKLKKQSLIQLSTDTRYEKQPVSLLLFMVLLVSLGLLLIFHPFSRPVNAVLIMALSIVGAFLGISLFIKLIVSLFQKTKHKSLFRSFSLHYLADNKYVHHSLRVLYASFLVILITFAIRNFIGSEISGFKDQLNLDYAIMNIFDYDASLKTEIENQFSVDKVHESVIYRDVRLYVEENTNNPREKVKFFVSMNLYEFEDDFGFVTESPVSQEYLDNDTPYILLPISHKYTSRLEIGDEVTLHINSQHDMISIEVAGFFDTSFDNIVYTNLAFIPEFSDSIRTNTLILQTDQTEGLLKSLAEEYGSDMYYVLDIQELIDEFESIFTTAGELFMLLTSVMIISFMIVIINNTVLVFYTMRNDYAKLKTLGVCNRDFFWNITKEVFLTSVCVIVFVVPEIFLLTHHLPYVMLFFGYYREIVPSFVTVLMAMSVIVVAFLCSYGFYYFKIKKMNMIEEIKIE